MARRFLPLVIILVLSVAALLARLWDIQVVQHRVWAREAANLVRSAEVDPYRRGEILDRKGRTLVHDEETYVLEFVWRDFRRGHPLGQVAMMRSLVLMRPVDLVEARLTLGEAALAYASLTPDDLDRFARGGELDAGVDYVPALAAESEAERSRLARLDRRRSRAGDLRYYLTRMLGLSLRDARTVNERIEDGEAGTESFIDLCAWVLDQSPVEVRDRLRHDVLLADEHLLRLAGLIAWPDEANALPLSAGDRLVGLMEERRREVEDESANELFRIAADVSPTRLDAAALRRFDLDWIRTALDWDRNRLEEWIETAGRGFERGVRSWLAAHTIARAKIEGAEPADRLISALAHAFRRDPEAWTRKHAAPQDWRQVRELSGLQALSERLVDGGVVPEELLATALPFQRESLHTAALEGEALLTEVLGDSIDQEALMRLATRTWSDWNRDDEAIVGDVLLAWHRRLQVRAGALLDRVEDEAGQLVFDDAHLERALETRRYVVRDRGARPKVVGSDPSIDLVLLVTRYPAAFAGFSVTSKMQRVALVTEGEYATPLAGMLVGRVRSPFLVEVLRQRPRLEELGELQRKLDLPKEDREEILRLADLAYQRDETVGGSGLEAWFDPELAGVSGYLEVHGLQDRVAGNRDPIQVAAKDGSDIVTTLDIDLQRAALDVLEHPELPPASIDNQDPSWFERPVGAIVLATVEGDILAAASVPTVSGLEPAELTDGERARAIDRTLLRPWAQPPGSVVKPLMAAYALQHLGLDPDQGLEFCDADRPRRGYGAAAHVADGRAGYGAIDCNVKLGHSHSFGIGAISLDIAIESSCNVYFAALGERYFRPESMRDACRTFGFGEPTGVLALDDGERRNLSDQCQFHPLSKLVEGASEALDEIARQRTANGLTEIDANVVQVARAYAGLATGRLPDMRLVSSAGGQPIVPRSQPLGIDDVHLERVRQAARQVMVGPRGSGRKALLSDEDLGFAFAGKTGSADYKPLEVPENDRGLRVGANLMRKHAWVAGWFPYEEPRFVVVVYLHDTLATSSRGAIFVASQFLRRDEIRQLVEAGVDR